MDEQEHTQTELPVLTGEWLQETHANLAESDSAVSGYDPYNNLLPESNEGGVGSDG